MRTSSTKNSLIIGISVVLGASLLSVGISNAAGTTIKACAKKSNGAMRLIDSTKSCKKSERTLTWGTQGDAGPTGATGASGSTGASGTNGSNGYSKVYTRSGGGFSLAPGEQLTSIASLTLPAGKYAVNFSMPVKFFNNNIATTYPRYLACSFTRSQTPSNSDYIWPRTGSSVPARTSFDPSAATSSYELGMKLVAGNFTLDLTTQTTIYLRCDHEEDGADANTNQNISGDGPIINAIQIDEIVSQS